jgi:homospermidine synthase
MVSHLVKRALLHLARDLGRRAAPVTREDWARLAHNLGVKGIHIAERDTQRARIPKQKDEFVNTWSIEGFLSEGLQPSELGWGTHEKHMPPEGARHAFGCDAAIYLMRTNPRLPDHAQRSDQHRGLPDAARWRPRGVSADLSLRLSSVRRRDPVAA